MARRVSWRIGGFVALAVGLGLVFVRLGLWQLDRLAERRARNAVVMGQLRLPTVPVTDVVREARREHRQVTVSGTPDVAHELVLTGRSRSGSPGVHIVTPLRLPGNDTAVLVNRGWVYSADARSVDLSRWRESRHAWSGYTLALDTGGAPAGQGRSLRRLSAGAVRALLPYPVHGVVVVAQDSQSATGPARLPAPALDEGPHFGYAIQWFAFATIAIVGAAVVITRARRSQDGGSTGA